MYGRVKRTGCQAVGLTLLLVVCLFNTTAFAKGEKQVVGYVEQVKLYPGGILMPAKLDTGADSPSMHCDCKTVFERDGKEWVRFTLSNGGGQQVEIERPIVRRATITRHFGEKQERLVIRMGICLANVYKELNVNVVDRSGFQYPVLVGRSFLEGDFIVDSEQSYTVKPQCADDAPEQ